MSHADVMKDIRRRDFASARREEAREVHRDALNYYQKFTESGVPTEEFKAARQRLERWGPTPHEYPHLPFTQMPAPPRRVETPPPGPSWRPDPAPCPATTPQDPTVQRYLEMRSRILGQPQEETCPNPPAPNASRIPQIAAAYDRYFNPETNYQQENICDITPPEWAPEFDDSF